MTWNDPKILLACLDQRKGAFISNFSSNGAFCKTKTKIETEVIL